MQVRHGQEVRGSGTTVEFGKEDSRFGSCMVRQCNLPKVRSMHGSAELMTKGSSSIGSVQTRFEYCRRHEGSGAPDYHPYTLKFVFDIPSYRSFYHLRPKSNICGCLVELLLLFLVGQEVLGRKWLRFFQLVAAAAPWGWELPSLGRCSTENARGEEDVAAAGTGPPKEVYG
ncbi:hypothetical protein E3N88_40353 [Mikania micrantha]|uniref:Uncharacterized protein n=1 Tax=Mikania micrantha TaxID=192012 RepID=A0A5N6LMF1_9ASTR|nr:hypothetical protein E3N88_40353 [Mikania micrantha]